MLVTDDDDVAARVRRLRWVGISRPTWERFQPGRPRHSWIYSVDEVGFKYEMNDLAASLGLVQLGKVEDNNERRRRLLARYRRAFASVPAVEMLATRDYALSSCYNAVVKIDERDRLYEHLDRHGIDANVHYYPNHLFSVYRPYATPLPVAEAEWQRILSIPLYTDLREEDQDRVIACIAAFAEERRPAATGSATP
jgi:perosamine synthetase